MTPAARLQMAIDILEGLGATDQPLDRFLKAWFRSRRFAGSKDRREIAETVFAVQRARARRGRSTAEPQRDRIHVCVGCCSRNGLGRHQ